MAYDGSAAQGIVNASHHGKRTVGQEAAPSFLRLYRVANFGR